MTEIHWVLAASAVIWLGLGAYLAFMAVRQKELEQRLRALEDTDEG